MYTGDCSGMRSNRLRVVSWDVDGTLYSLKSMKLALFWIAIKRLAFERRRTLRELTELQRIRLKADEVRDAGGTLRFKLSSAQVSEKSTLEERWYGEAIRAIGPRKCITEVLGAIKRAGFLQIVVSDIDCAYKLKALQIADFFDHVFAGEILGHLKPAPMLFKLVTQELKVRPDELLHIGDRQDTDHPAATGAGCNVLIIGRDFKSLRELPRRIDTFSQKVI